MVAESRMTVNDMQRFWEVHPVAAASAHSLGARVFRRLRPFARGQ